MTTRDSKYTRSKLKRKKLHDDSRIYIEENFFKIDVDYIRRQPVMYVMNTEYKEHHEIWAYHAGLMFEKGFVRSISTINEFNYSRITKQMKNEKYIFYRKVVRKIILLYHFQQARYMIAMTRDLKTSIAEAITQN